MASKNILTGVLRNEIMDMTFEEVQTFRKELDKQLPKFIREVAEKSKTVTIENRNDKPDVD